MTSLGSRPPRPHPTARDLPAVRVLDIGETDSVAGHEEISQKRPQHTRQNITQTNEIMHASLVQPVVRIAPAPTRAGPATLTAMLADPATQIAGALPRLSRLEVLPLSQGEIDGFTKTGLNVAHQIRMYAWPPN